MMHACTWAVGYSAYVCYDVRNRTTVLVVSSATPACASSNNHTEGERSVQCKRASGGTCGDLATRQMTRVNSACLSCVVAAAVVHFSARHEPLNSACLILNKTFHSNFHGDCKLDYLILGMFLH